MKAQETLAACKVKLNKARDTAEKYQRVLDEKDAELKELSIQMQGLVRVAVWGQGGHVVATLCEPLRCLNALCRTPRPPLCLLRISSAAIEAMSSLLFRSYLCLAAMVYPAQADAVRKAKKVMEDRMHELGKLQEELHTLLRKPRAEQVGALIYCFLALRCLAWFLPCFVDAYLPCSVFDASLCLHVLALCLKLCRTV